MHEARARPAEAQATEIVSIVPIVPHLIIISQVRDEHGLRLSGAALCPSLPPSLPLSLPLSLTLSVSVSGSFSVFGRGVRMATSDPAASDS